MISWGDCGIRHLMTVGSWFGRKMVRVVRSEKMPSARSVWLSRALAASRLPLQMVMAVCGTALAAAGASTTFHG